MRGIPWRLLGLGALTALLLDLPFPIAGPLPAWRAVFAWFALVPLLTGLLGLAGRYPERKRRWVLGWSLLTGWLCGALWFGTNCYWVYNTMHTYGNMNGLMAAVCLVSFSVYLGFWFGVFALALALVRLATAGRKFAWLAWLAIPFLWTATEFALARIPEFPWDQLGYSQVDNGLLTRIAPWAGVYGISFVLAAINAALAAGSLATKRLRVNELVWRTCGSVAVLIAFVLSAGVRFAPPKPSGEAAAVLVQPNLNVITDDVWLDPEWDRQIAQFREFGRQVCGSSIAGMPETGLPETGSASLQPPCDPAQAPSLIVWPESPAPFRDADPKFQSAMAAIAQADRAPMIVGNVGMDLVADPATGAQQYNIYNSASLVAKDGHLAGRYDKIHLVPFGEFVPFRRLLFFVQKLTQNLSDLSTGTDRKVFRIPSPDDSRHAYGVFICYESVFGDEVRHFAQLGAEVFVNISDDGWYGDTSAPWQHLNMARMRAIENHRWILRDTNNGVTAVIDPYGTVRQSIPRHQVGALAGRFGYATEVTFYTQYGDWVAWICAACALVMTVWAVRVLLLSKIAK
jgi:apolipoprotein N-acyltransferase